MVERVARSGRLIVDGHHDLETDLRNKSGKVEHKTLWVNRIPPASFFFRIFNISYNEEKGFVPVWWKPFNKGTPEKDLEFKRVVVTGV